MTTKVAPRTEVAREAAIESLERVQGWLWLATKSLSEPAFAALFLDGADPINAVNKLGEAVTAVEALRQAFQGARPSK
jgi:hypothetical protein